MAALSDYLEQALINHLFRESSFAQPTTVAIALLNASGVDADTGITIPELAEAGSYARVVASGNLIWDAPGAPGLTSNTAEIAFTQASANWGHVSGVTTSWFRSCLRIK